MEIKEEIIKHIVDIIEEFGNEYCTHPNDNVKLFSASRLVDNEVMKRLAIINERNKEDGTIFVGHCGSIDDPVLEVAEKDC